jgi:Skp family chaperone for outer membrane proteins
MSKTMLMAAAAVALGVCALPATAALYKWVDANGRVVYSDQPPPASANVKTETLHAPTAPSNPNAAKELAQKDMELKRRAAERNEAAAKAEKDQTAKTKRAEECNQANAALQRLSWGQVVILRANEKGEQVPMDDAARAKEKARIEGWMKENCA